jgi:hypothetical protein
VDDDSLSSSSDDSDESEEREAIKLQKIMQQIKAERMKAREEEEDRSLPLPGRPSVDSQRGGPAVSVVKREWFEDAIFTDQITTLPLRRLTHASRGDINDPAQNSKTQALLRRYII